MFNYYKDKKNSKNRLSDILIGQMENILWEMARSAQKRKLKMILLSEHSRKVAKIGLISLLIKLENIKK